MFKFQEILCTYYLRPFRRQLP